MTILLTSESIRGESAIAGFTGWATANSCEFGAAANYGKVYANTQEENVSFLDLTIERATDASSPFFLLNIWSGKFDETFKIAFLRTGDDGPVPYLQLELGNCGVTGISVVADGARPIERITLAFRSFDMRAFKHGDDITGAPVSATYDTRQQR